MRKAIYIFLLTVAIGAEAAEAPHPFTARDLNAMQRISDPRPSPDGRQVAFVVRTTDFEANRGRNDLWLVGIDGSGATRLTTDAAADTDPRWAPDGKGLYFMSTRSGSSQLWRIPIPGTDKEAVQITDLPLDVSNLLMSPDGSRLAFSLEVFPDCPTVACTVDRLAAKEKSKTSARVYDGGFARHWDTWSDGRRNHLFVASLSGNKIGEPVDLTQGMWADVPSKPFGDATEWAFAPDGKTLVFAARLAGEKNREEPWSTNFDLYEARVDGSGEPRNLTAANPAWDTQPVFAPDGKTLAYLRMSRPGFEATASGSSCATWLRARSGSWRRSGTAPRMGWSSQPTARPSTPRPMTRGRCRCSPSTWPAAARASSSPTDMCGISGWWGTASSSAATP